MTKLFLLFEDTSDFSITINGGVPSLDVKEANQIDSESVVQICSINNHDLLSATQVSSFWCRLCAEANFDCQEYLGCNLKAQ